MIGQRQPLGRIVPSGGELFAGPLGQRVGCAPAGIGSDSTVAITPFLSGQPFEPEALHNMSAAFDSVCTQLGLAAARRNEDVELVARKIVELAQRGVRDPILLRTMTLQEFGRGD